MRLVGQAIADWGMIKDGDRLLLGLSGGAYVVASFPWWVDWVAPAFSMSRLSA